MKPLNKVGWVVGGYILALAVAAVVAAAAMAFHVLATGGPGGPGYSGMYAFFDSLVFLAAFAVAALPATGLALYFLRPHQAFWRVFPAGALGFALTGVAAFMLVASANNANFATVASAVAFLRILMAPLFALNFLLAGIFAPHRAARLALFMATAMEVTVFAGWVITCVLRNFAHA